jgi:anti-sigma factor RsiW
MKLKRAFWRRSDPQVNCHEVGKVIQAYLDGELENDTDKVAAHIEACKICGLEAETYSKIKQALRAPESEIDAETVTRLREFGEGLISED